MTQNELMKSVDRFFGECQETVNSRNQKYSNLDDALFNIEQGAMTAKITVERALVHWIADKTARLSNLTTAWENGEVDAVDGLLDTLHDLAGYAALYNAEMADWIPGKDDVDNYVPPSDFGGQHLGDPTDPNSANYEPPNNETAFEKFKTLMGIGARGTNSTGPK